RAATAFGRGAAPYHVVPGRGPDPGVPESGPPGQPSQPAIRRDAGSGKGGIGRADVKIQAAHALPVRQALADAGRAQSPPFRRHSRRHSPSRPDTPRLAVNPAPEWAENRFFSIYLRAIACWEQSRAKLVFRQRMEPPNMDIAKRRIPKPSPARMLALALLAAIPSLTAIGCKEEKAQATVLAQVGEASLTLEELRESFPVEFEQLIRREQYLDFIKRWMDDEVVYQQALKAKIDSDPAIKRKLDKVRRKLLIEEYLAKENAAEVYEPDEIAMNQYYE